MGLKERNICKKSDLEGIYNTLSTNSQSIVNIGRLIGANGEWYELNVLIEKRENEIADQIKLTDHDLEIIAERAKFIL